MLFLGHSRVMFQPQLHYLVLNPGFVKIPHQSAESHYRAGSRGIGANLAILGADIEVIVLDADMRHISLRS